MERKLSILDAYTQIPKRIGVMSMKYLGLHKILWAILVLVWLIIEILYFGSFYILYVIWNFKIPRNFWLEFHSGRSSWDYESIVDKNPIQTFIRRYKFMFE